MLKHGLLGTSRDSVTQMTGEIGCGGAQEVTGDMFGHAWSRRVKTEKTIQQIGFRRHQKHHQQHNKKYKTVNQYIIKLSVPKESDQTRKKSAARRNNTARNVTAKQQNQQTS